MARSVVTGFATPGENEAYHAGFRYGYYGVGKGDKQRICSTPEKIRAWNMGKRAGEDERDSNDYYFSEY